MKKTGLITALAPEAKCLTNERFVAGETVEISPGILLTVCGIGQDRAHRATAELIDQGVEQIISIGTAGGLSQDVSSGDICLPQQLITDDSGTLQTHAGLHTQMQGLLRGQSRAIHEGLLFSTNQLVSSAQQKSFISQTFGAIAIDMESAAVLQLAQQHQLPAIAVRVIVDTAEMHLPDAVIKHTDEFGNPKVLDFSASLLRHPGQISQLIKLARRFNQARDSLKYLSRIIARLQ